MSRTSSRALLTVICLTIACNANIDGTGRRVAPGEDPGSGGTSSSGGSGGGAQPGGGQPGGATGLGGNGSTGPSGSGGAASCGASALPAEIQSLLGPRCQLCHGNPPLPTVPGSLMTTDDFARPAKSNPSLTMAESTMMRVTMGSTMLRMPPVPASPLTSAEIQTLQAWFGAGHPPAACDPAVVSPDGGASNPPVPAPDPFAVPARCTSGTTWTGGTRESPLMQPGEACVACHTKGEAPRLSFGGTLYPSAHEPSQCNGASGTGSFQGAQVVIVDANGMTFTAQVNAAGNFYASARVAVALPIKAKVVFMGRERLMIGAVPTGDCNACHTQKGTTTLTTAGALPAPGRIILP
jgi:hypothetical protein